MGKTWKVGDRISIPFGSGRALGVVTEDRGPLGVGGRRIYQIRVYLSPDEVSVFELPGDELAPPDPALTRPLEREEILEYLENAGLVSILRANIVAAQPT